MRQVVNPIPTSTLRQLYVNSTQLRPFALLALGSTPPGAELRIAICFCKKLDLSLWISTIVFLVNPRVELGWTGQPKS